MNMDGIKLVELKNINQVVVEELSDALKQEIEERLTEYCHGAAEALSDPDTFTFKRTLREFFDVYDSKPNAARIGLAGELLVHILLERAAPHLERTCVYLNKEENNVKKGFDLTLLEPKTKSLWYGEVKSGEVKPGISADDKARDLIGVAIRGLKTMFTTDVSDRRWRSAKIDAGLVLAPGEADTVKKLLGSNLRSVEAKAGFKPNALLAAVVMHDRSLSELTSDRSSKVTEGSRAIDIFEKTWILLIQQDEIETVVQFLREKANENGTE